MTEAEQLLIAAADLNMKAAAAERNDRTVQVAPEVIRELAYWIEACGRITARAGGIRNTGPIEGPIEHAHDIARTHLGDSK
ncbi:hypothetical protein ACFXAS_05410 [Streptomyces sp. NPDC059459]|uniref:hypothetical protein n=1 Tax=Streptomyces sp. NPDC059459 TaxID=3346839 RepID=UPI00368C552A